MKRVQIAVVGGGLVGSTAALALSRAGFSVALIERAAPPAPTPGFDFRIYALAPASVALLENLGVWQQLDASRMGPIYRMDVSGDGCGFLRYDAYEAGVPRLATSVENNRLQHALWNTLIADDRVAMHCPARVCAIVWGQPHSTITFDDGSTLAAELIVGADGIDSRVREFAGLAAVKTAYGQHGLVANFACEFPHRGTAFEWFAGDGNIVAWLPLGGNHVSLVWSADSHEVEAQLSLDAAQTARYARDRVAVCADANACPGRQVLGELTLLNTPRAFPLSMLRVLRLTAPGAVVIGDAAHGVHPLAGQGVNLGFGDVACLVDTLRAARRGWLGDPRVLARHERLRAEAVALMQATTHGLYHLFADSHPKGLHNPGLVQVLRNTGMSAINCVPPLKTALIHRALK